MHSFGMELRNTKWRDEALPPGAAYPRSSLHLAATFQPREMLAKTEWTNTTYKLP